MSIAASRKRPSATPVAVVAPAAPAKVQTELEARVAYRKRELVEELIEHKKSVRYGAAEAGDRIKGRLLELSHILQAGVVDGWANVDKATRCKLDRWMDQ